jgi:hypothetical protein
MVQIKTKVTVFDIHEEELYHVFFESKNFVTEIDFRVACMKYAEKVVDYGFKSVSDGGIRRVYSPRIIGFTELEDFVVEDEDETNA